MIFNRGNCIVYLINCANINLIYFRRFAAHKRARDAREKQKQSYKAEKAASLQEKAIAYQSKEQNTMDMFKKLAEEQRKAGRGMWSQSNNSDNM